MEELADSQSSGGCFRKEVWVRLPPLAPSNLTDVMNIQNTPWIKSDVYIALLCCLVWVCLSLAFSFLNIESVGVSLAVTVLFNFVVVLIALFIFVKLRKGNLKDFGFKKFSERHLDIGCGLFLLSYIFNVVYGMLVTFFVPDLPVQGYEFMKIMDQLSNPGLFVVLGSLIIPVTEEIFFRGFLFSSLNKFWGFKIAAVFSSLIFAFMHFFVTAFLPIFVLSLVLCYIFYKSGSLYINILLHIFLNTTSLLLLWFINSNIGV